MGTLGGARFCPSHKSPGNLPKLNSKRLFCEKNNLKLDMNLGKQKDFTKNQHYNSWNRRNPFTSHPPHLMLEGSLAVLVVKTLWKDWHGTPKMKTCKMIFPFQTRWFLRLHTHPAVLDHVKQIQRRFRDLSFFLLCIHHKNFNQEALGHMNFPGCTSYALKDGTCNIHVYMYGIFLYICLQFKPNECICSIHGGHQGYSSPK